MIFTDIFVSLLGYLYFEENPNQGKISCQDIYLSKIFLNDLRDKGLAKNNYNRIKKKKSNATKNKNKEKNSSSNHDKILLDDFYSQIYEVRANQKPLSKRNKKNTYFGFYGFVPSTNKYKDPKDTQITVKDIQGLLKKR